MVDEPGNIPHLCWIDRFAVAGSHEVCTSGVFVFLNFFCSDCRVDIENFSDVLHDESTFSDEPASSQSPTFIGCFERIDVGILVLLETPVLAVFMCGAGLQMTFC